MDFIQSASNLLNNLVDKVLYSTNKIDISDEQNHHATVRTYRSAIGSLLNCFGKHNELRTSDHGAIYLNLVDAEKARSILQLHDSHKPIIEGFKEFALKNITTGKCSYVEDNGSKTPLNPWHVIDLEKISYQTQDNDDVKYPVFDSDLTGTKGEMIALINALKENKFNVDKKYDEKYAFHRDDKVSKGRFWINFEKQTFLEHENAVVKNNEIEAFLIDLAKANPEMQKRDNFQGDEHTVNQLKIVNRWIVDVINNSNLLKEPKDKFFDANE